MTTPQQNNWDVRPGQVAWSTYVHLGSGGKGQLDGPCWDLNNGELEAMDKEKTYNI